MTLYNNRTQHAPIYLAAIATLLILPILYILMLPSLVFGNNGLDTASGNVLNNSSLIMDNIAEAEGRIEAILREKHGAVLDKIQSEADSLGDNCEYGITDEFADQIIYESTLIISQFCASQSNYKEINVDKLEKVMRDNTDNIFGYSTEVTSRTETDDETGENYTVSHYEYTVEYAGEGYYADNVFFLTEDQSAIADEYASNLHLFLFDCVYQVEVNPDLSPGETGDYAVSLALTKQGTPYSQAHRNDDGYFDCSSFTYWVYSQLGINLQYDGSNTAAAQGRYITENNLAVSYDSLAPGDLIFYSFEVNNRYMNISHVAIYAGNGYVVDASSSKKKVVYRPIYNTNRIVLCGRPYTN
jgi:hypothetical protein